MTRPETTWLTFGAGSEGLVLHEHHRTYTALQDLSSLETQTPQMITLIGRDTKTRALRKLRSGSAPNEGVRGEVQLRVALDTLTEPDPVLYADCEMHNFARPVGIGADQYRDIVSRPLPFSKGLNPTSLAHQIYAKLLFPFSTAVCLFADDLGGLSAAADVVASWLTVLKCPPTDLPTSANPEVIIFQKATSAGEDTTTRKFLSALNREIGKRQGSKLNNDEFESLLGKIISRIHVLNLPDLKASQVVWAPLRDRLRHISKNVQGLRRDNQVSFSANHFTAFFHLACDHFASNADSPFSFVAASRFANPIPEEIPTHIASFLKHVSRNQVLNFAVPIIASALVFDSYPPGMHAFNPWQVFRTFFYQICLELDPFEFPQMTLGIESAFSQFAMVVVNTTDGVSIHRKTLSRFSRKWKIIHSNTTCFGCLARKPENTLTCQHSFCDECIVSFGEEQHSEHWKFLISCCPLCSEENTRHISLKPKTAGVRTIIAEGGGIKGIVPLSFLKDLETAIGLPMNVSEHFDVAFGSSSGALVILGLFVKGWPVEVCLEQFQTLSEVAFRKRFRFSRAFWFCRYLAPFLDMILAIATDSHYSSKGINRALQSVFDPAVVLFGASASGAKIGITATTTKDCSTCIFTNYNGQRRRSDDCGYRVIRPEDAEKEVCVWQAARASSAAPPYFKPFDGYQDGGLSGHNNPINLALWEQDKIWSRCKKQPDVVVSLGTGFIQQNVEDTSSKLAAFLRSRCMPRLFRSFMNSFIGESRWRELLNTLSPQERDRYHRLNIEFRDSEPAIDDIGAINELRQQVKYQAGSNDHIQRCADNLLASLFYLELEDVPVYDRTVYICRARILCRLNACSSSLRVLIGRLVERRARFHIGFQNFVFAVDQGVVDNVEAGIPFSKTVVFKVRTLRDAVDIKIDGIVARARSISNCPYTVESLINDQGLNCVFGRRGLKRVNVHSEQQSVKRSRLN